MNRVEKRFVLTVLVAVIYSIWFYMVSKFFFDNDMLIGIHNLTKDNIFIKLADDYLAMLFFPTIIIIINRKNLKEYGLKLDSKKEIFILFGIMITFFILHNDFTLRGFYKFFFHLIVVSFGEEFFFRGFIYNRLKTKSVVIAIILSGMLWGIGHAILPAILSEESIIQMLSAMRYEVFGGIISGWYFIYLQEQSRTIWVPVLIHALLNYTFSFFGQLLAVIIFIYFKLKSKKDLEFQTSVKELKQ